MPPAPVDADATQALGADAAQQEREEADDNDLSFLAASTRPDSLGRIGHYEVLQVLGQGGFGIVFRAFDEVLQRVVAVKVLAPHDGRHVAGPQAASCAKPDPRRRFATRTSSRSMPSRNSRCLTW